MKANDNTEKDTRIYPIINLNINNSTQAIEKFYSKTIKIQDGVEHGITVPLDCATKQTNLRNLFCKWNLFYTMTMARTTKISFSKI